MIGRLLHKAPESLRKLVLYAMCGGSGVALDFITYALLVQIGIWYQAANIVGYALGTLLSFVLNRAITFKVMDAPARRLAVFLSVALVGYSLSFAALWLLIEQLHVGELLAKAATLILVLIVQFSLNSLITFRASEGARR